MANICRDGGGGYATTAPLRGSSPFCGCGICGTLETRETPGTRETPETRETPGTLETRETLCYSLTSILQRTRGQRYGGWWGDVNPNTV